MGSLVFPLVKALPKFDPSVFSLTGVTPLDPLVLGGSPLDFAQLKATLVSSLIPEIGTVTITATRSGSVETGLKYDPAGLIQFTSVADEAIFEGARRVRNLLPSTEGTFSGGGWTQAGNISVTSGITDPNGGSTAYTLSQTGATSAELYTTSAPTCPTPIGSVWIRRRTGSGSVRLYAGSFYKDITASLTTSWQQLKTLATDTATSSVGFELRLYTNGDAVDFWHPQLEDVTGESDQTTPREYVSVGVLSAPYHGANVDGVKYFPYDLSGNPIPTSTLGGMTSWPAATQLIAATADIRDMTTASWTLGATMTRARTSVGWDGGANLATRLTGGAVAATNTITYTLVAAASSRTYSVGIKRITGTGPVRLTQDNFATNTDISSQLISGQWVRVLVTQSQLNAVFGIKVDTNGDAIDADMNQFEAGTAATPPILTGGATRNAWTATYTGGDTANYKTLACTFKRPVGVSSTGYVAALSDGTLNNYLGFYLASSGTALRFEGVASAVGQWAQAASNAYTPGTLSRVAQSFATNDIKMDFNGVAQTPDTVATIPTVTQLNLGHVAGSFQLGGTIKNVYAWTSNRSQAELAAIDK